MKQTAAVIHAVDEVCAKWKQPRFSVYWPQLLAASGPITPGQVSSHLALTSPAAKISKQKEMIKNAVNIWECEVSHPHKTGNTVISMTSPQIKSCVSLKDKIC